MAEGGQAPTDHEGFEMIGDMNEEEQDMIKNMASAGGAKKTEILKKLQNYAAENMEAWKNQKVYVGLVGDPGAGKSSFMNSIRGLEPEKPGAAEVGLDHTTEIPTDYPHPARPESLIFVDFPGVLLEKGSGDERDFDIQQYLDKFGEKMEQCHVFLVFSSGRIQHNAVQIGMKARDMGKKVLFVRSKFDRDLEDRKNDKPGYFKDKTEADLMEELRQGYIKGLKKLGWGEKVNPRDVFIISGRLNHVVLKGSWDIPKFRKAMIESLGSLQKMVVINTCRDFSKATIKERGDVYRSKVWLVAMAATVGSFVPVAGVGAIPAALVIAYDEYKEGFCLTPAAMEHLAKMTGKSLKDLETFFFDRLLGREKLEERNNEAWKVVQAICSGFGITTLAAIAVDQVVDVAVPVIGAIITAPLAFTTTYKVLHAMISRMEKCAGQLFDYALKESAV